MTRRHLVVLLIALLIVLLISVVPSRATRDKADGVSRFQAAELSLEHRIDDGAVVSPPLASDRISE